MVYAFDRSDVKKRDVATRLLRDADLTQYVVTAQVLSEFYVTVTRTLAEPPSLDEAGAVVERLAKLEWFRSPATWSSSRSREPRRP